MGDPSGNSWNCEQDWEHVSWEAHGSVNEATVEVNIGVEFASNTE